MQPGSTLYSCAIVRDHRTESGTDVTLTKEINCLLLWRHTWIHDESDELVIVGHFQSWQTNQAIEFAVGYAQKLKAQHAPGVEPLPYRCSICGEISDTGLDCCDDDIPEPGDMRETGK